MVDADAPAQRKGTRDALRDAKPTRELILEAATIEFATKGIGGARVDEIAARSGANKRMIYHYFGDKQGLYLAVLERTYEEIRVAETKLQLEELEPRRRHAKADRVLLRLLHPSPAFHPVARQRESA